MADKKETEVVNGTTSDKEPVAINQDVTKTGEKSEYIKNNIYSLNKTRFLKVTSLRTYRWS